MFFKKRFVKRMIKRLQRKSTFTKKQINLLQDYMTRFLDTEKGKQTATFATVETFLELFLTYAENLPDYNDQDWE